MTTVAISSLMYRGLVRHVLQQGRCIFTASGVGMDQFVRIKEMTAVRLGTAQASIRERVTEDIKTDGKPVFSEDLKNLLYSADNDEDINTLLEGLKKYYKDGAGYSNFHFGAPIMRLLSFYNKTEKAIELFVDKSTEAAFKDSASALVLMNHLIERRRFDDAVKIFEAAKARGFVTASGKSIPSDVLMLFVEALFCLNTPEAFVKLEKVLKDAKHSDCNITLRAIGMSSLFAIKQNRPDIALEITGYGRNQSSPLFRNIKAICFADLGRLDEAMQTIRIITESSATPGVSMRFERHVYPIVMNHIRKAVEKSDDPTMKEKLESLVRIIYDGKLMTNNDLEQFLLTPINRTYAGNQQNQAYGQDNINRTQAGAYAPYRQFNDSGPQPRYGQQQSGYNQNYYNQQQDNQYPAPPQQFANNPSGQYQQHGNPYNQSYSQPPQFRQPAPFGSAPNAFARPAQAGGFVPNTRPGFGAPGYSGPPAYGGQQSAQPMNQAGPYQTGARPPLRSPLSGSSPTAIRNFSNPTSNRQGPNDEDL